MSAHQENLMALALRCEGAMHPDRLLDQAIAEATRTWLWKREYRRSPKFTGSIDEAMLLMPRGIELAIYTQWPLTKGFPRSRDRSIKITHDMPRGVWIRSTGSGATKNIESHALMLCLGISAFALRAIAAIGDGE